MTDPDPADILQLVKDALDASITDPSCSDLSRKDYGENQNCLPTDPSYLGPGVLDPVEEQHIDIEDYCKMMHDYRESNCIATMDSRMLIEKEQSQLDSQHTYYSVENLHDRIRSFDIVKWSQKPDCISSFECARFGWKLTEWGFLACVTCKKILHVPSQLAAFNSFSWAKKLRAEIESSGHLSTCPWTRMPSPVDILSIPKASDLLNYFHESVSSYKAIRTSPVLESSYESILTNLNLIWLKEVTMHELPETTAITITDNILNPELLKTKILFLVINGWSIGDTEDLITCKLCLREVPLWLYGASRLNDDNNTSASEGDNENQIKNIARKEFNPVANHWTWCPWYQRLSFCTRQSSDAIGVMVSDLNGTDSSKCTKLEDYAKLIDEFKNECNNFALAYDKNKSHAQLIGSVTSLFDNFVASSTLPVLDNSDLEALNGNGVKEPSAGTSSTSFEISPITNNQPFSVAAVITEESEDNNSNQDSNLSTPPKKRIRREMFDNTEAT